MAPALILRPTSLANSIRNCYFIILRHDFYQGGEDTRIGQPTIEGARVLGEVVDHPTTKLYIQHFRRRKNYRRLRGHRQPYTSVQIRHILLPGQEAPPPERRETATAAAPVETPPPAKA